MDDTPPPVRSARSVSHYYGDVVRGLFLGAAILMLISGFMSVSLPIPGIMATIWIVVLVLIAGITNPLQRWIHWMNVVISIIGLLVFGGALLSGYSSYALFSSNAITALITLIFVLSLYFATRTLRASILLSRLR